ncbi:hypothetical protein ACIA5G_39620 [Amycolatopsis sp. NPDC051758]|uniref:hypothetical protein n=1 Tax=Amycolatopsis sp. NPDC051758 TaxID=3363935 RepID=UPI003794B385
MSAPPAKATAGLASRRGRRPLLCDAASQFLFRNSGVLAVSVVDGIGNNDEVAAIAPLCAEASVRLGARKGVLPGVMTAAGLLEDSGDEMPTPDAVMALAVCRPAQPTAIGYLGDVAAYGWNGQELTLLTTAHTKGERLRAAGAEEDVAAKRDNIVITSLARATPTTVALAETLDEVVLLLSDGVHRTLSSKQIVMILREHGRDAAACAAALVDAASEASTRDDATAAVIIHDGPIRRDGITQLGR